MNRRPGLSIVAGDASPEEAAAVVAALTQFMRARTPPPAQAREGSSPWTRAALHEGVTRQPDAPPPWA